MNLTQSSVTGIQPPTTPKTNASNVGVAVTTTSTYYGRAIVIKAISDAAMYKTQPVSFFSNWNNGTTSTLISLGTSTFVSPTTAPLVVPFLQTGTHQIYVTWPGENKFAPFTTINTPITVTINAGLQLNGELQVTSAPPSGTLVEGEGSVVFSALMTTEAPVNGEITFYDGSTYLGSSSLVRNTTTFSTSVLTSGTHNIIANWPGGVLQDGNYYEGKTTYFNYEVLRGASLNSNLTLTVNPLTNVYQEGFFNLKASFTTSTNLAGAVSFYDGDQFLAGPITLTSNSATVTISNTLTNTGTSYITAVWDGNQSSHPKYIEKTSNPIPVEIFTATTLPSLGLEINPNPSVYFYDTTQFIAFMNTTTNVHGWVYFYANDRRIGQAQLVQNIASLTLSTLNTGTYSVYASYPGSLDAHPRYYPIQSSTATYTVLDKEITQLVLTSESDPAYQLSLITFDVTSTNHITTLTNAVSLYEQVGTSSYLITSTIFQDVNHAKFIVDPNILSASTTSHHIYASWVGQDVTDGYIPFSSTVSNTVIENIDVATISLTVDPNPQIIGGSVEVTATLNHPTDFTNEHVDWKLLSPVFTTTYTTQDITIPKTIKNFSDTPISPDICINYANWWWAPPGLSESIGSIYEVLTDVPYYGSWIFQNTNRDQTYTTTGDWLQLRTTTAIPGNIQYFIMTATDSSNNTNITDTYPILSSASDDNYFYYNLGIPTNTTFDPYYFQNPGHLYPFNVNTQDAFFYFASRHFDNTTVNLTVKARTIVSNRTLDHYSTSTIGTSTIASNVATIGISSSTLITGTFYVSANIENVNPAISNVTSFNIVPRGPTELSIALSTNSWTYYNLDRSTNTNVVATISIAGTYTTHLPDLSRIYLMDTTGNFSLGTATAITTNTATVSWDPEFINGGSQMDAGDRRLVAYFPGDTWNLPSQAIVHFSAKTKVDVTPTVTPIVNTGLYISDYWASYMGINTNTITTSTFDNAIVDVSAFVNTGTVEITLSNGGVSQVTTATLVNGQASLGWTRLQFSHPQGQYTGGGDYTVTARMLTTSTYYNFQVGQATYSKFTRTAASLTDTDGQISVSPYIPPQFRDYSIVHYGSSSGGIHGGVKQSWILICPNNWPITNQPQVVEYKDGTIIYY